MTEWTYTRIDDGWGARAYGKLGRKTSLKGAAIEITTKAGEVHQRVVAEVVRWKKYGSTATLAVVQLTEDEAVAAKAQERFAAAKAQQAEDRERARAEYRAARAAERASSPRTRLVGTHSHEPCSCGNWSGAGSPCLYSYGAAKDADEHRHIQWQRVAA